MAYTTDELQAYVDHSKKRKERFNILVKEAEEAEKEIDKKQKEYQKALNDDEDEGALKVLYEITQLKNRIRFKNDKATMLSKGEDQVKRERAATAMLEYDKNKKEFDKIIVKEERELKELEAPYIEKAKKIEQISRNFQNLHSRYEGTPETVGDKHKKISMYRSQVIPAHKYEIKDFK